MFTSLYIIAIVENQMQTAMRHELATVWGSGVWGVGNKGQHVGTRVGWVYGGSLPSLGMHNDITSLGSNGHTRRGRPA